MDLALLTRHNLSRWLVLAAAISVLARMLGGLRTRRIWSGADTTAGRIFVALMDWRRLLGLLLAGAAAVRGRADHAGGVRSGFRRGAQASGPALFCRPTRGDHADRGGTA
ncbi:hypothetical protein [Deinococcus sp.]|uniref:hypothetical protein n=1 Tax=Deinococcus sp. TaxID=47478 RepID=UPI0025E0C998|nr:hypothetical protein [Deinococcus sp.]